MQIIFFSSFFVFFFLLSHADVPSQRPIFCADSSSAAGDATLQDGLDPDGRSAALLLPCCHWRCQVHRTGWRSVPAGTCSAVSWKRQFPSSLSFHVTDSRNIGHVAWTPQCQNRPKVSLHSQQFLSSKDSWRELSNEEDDAPEFTPPPPPLPPPREPHNGKIEPAFSPENTETIKPVEIRSLGWVSAACFSRLYVSWLS